MGNGRWAGIRGSAVWESSGRLSGSRTKEVEERRACQEVLLASTEPALEGEDARQSSLQTMESEVPFRDGGSWSMCAGLTLTDGGREADREGKLGEGVQGLSRQEGWDPGPGWGCICDGRATPHSP